MSKRLADVKKQEAACEKRAAQLAELEKAAAAAERCAAEAAAKAAAAEAQRAEAQRGAGEATAAAAEARRQAAEAEAAGAAAQAKLVAESEVVVDSIKQLVDAGNARRAEVEEQLQVRVARVCASVCVQGRAGGAGCCWGLRSGLRAQAAQERAATQWRQSPCGRTCVHCPAGAEAAGGRRGGARGAAAGAGGAAEAAAVRGRAAAAAEQRR